MNRRGEVGYFRVAGVIYFLCKDVSFGGGIAMGAENMPSV
jgi:hypothetical protein